MTLRLRLVIGLVVLVTIGLAVFGVGRAPARRSAADDDRTGDEHRPYDDHHRHGSHRGRADASGCRPARDVRRAARRQ
jgi:hypothetical protein